MLMVLCCWILTVVYICTVLKAKEGAQDGGADNADNADNAQVVLEDRPAGILHAAFQHAPSHRTEQTIRLRAQRHQGYCVEPFWLCT